MALMKRSSRCFAHQRTIAVTGTGLDTTYPAQNKKLAQQIISKRRIITEFLPLHRLYSSIFHGVTASSVV
jgi:predicted Rossmann fold nucleotide-binding protein DprA/Smf involved in DNA uptake